MSDTIRRADVTLANWREHPFSRWSFQNVREIVPTAVISSGRGGEPSRAGGFEGLTLRKPDGVAIGAEDFFRQSHTDSIMALKDGRFVAEWHGGHVDPARPHIIFSISKSITGALAGAAVDDGVLDPDAPITDYVPEIAGGGAYADATVRHLLDMTVSLEFVEDYLDRSGPFDRYRRAMLWNPETRPDAVETMLDVLASLPRAGRPHGEAFYYASPDTDMMGIVLERATGRRFSDFLAERIWEPMGATGQAYVTVDRVGAARAAGGVCVTPHDLARLGALVMNDGVAASGARLLPSSWIDDIRSNGDRAAWLKGDSVTILPDARYRSFWYDVGDGRGTLAAIGIHGQYIWADPTSGVVVVRTASRPAPSDDPLTIEALSVLAQIARAI
ncbi:MAG: beta-lactamase family protein [Rhizobiaceae bacterium]|nr:beta-lactamase family protein [Rhizobiaceae bacterium]MCV0405378.1 beta-lactamase family protein [Rhizobiaceae bacterium]